ncbi:MAG TPA: MBL fold metallo-hydrolase [Vicinamibacteria bacterium]|nr:MBL fold metallo-hydrolase [Vicinamibacteria bacterium]
MRKKILIALAVVVALPVLALGALFAIREPPDGPRVVAEPGVIGIEAGGAYAWIVRTPHGAVLVDAGLDAQGQAILAELRSEGVAPDQVLAVLITHGHPDHYAAAPLFTKARILVGAGDQAMMHGDKTHYAAFGKILSAVLTLPPGPQGAIALQGGEELEFDGARFKVVATPGHSPGSMMYLHGDILFTGDSLLRKKGGLDVPPSLMSDNVQQNRDSLRALEPLAFEKIADGHAGVTLGAKDKLVRWLAASTGH